MGQSPDPDMTVFLPAIVVLNLRMEKCFCTPEYRDRSVLYYLERCSADLEVAGVTWHDTDY